MRQPISIIKLCGVDGEIKALVTPHGILTATHIIKLCGADGEIKALVTTHAILQ